MSISQVLELLSELDKILKDCSASDWEDVVSTRYESLRKAAQAGNDGMLRRELQEIRGLYGGMGSFSDVYVSYQAGDNIDPGQVRSVNSRLQRLRTELFISVGREIERLGDGGGDIPA